MNCYKYYCITYMYSGRCILVHCKNKSAFDYIHTYIGSSIEWIILGSRNSREVITKNNKKPLTSVYT